MGYIRIGDLEFAVEAAELSCLAIPAGALELSLSVIGKPAHGYESLHFSLDAIRIPGRSIDEVAGHMTNLDRGVQPVPHDPRSEYLTAALYVGTHMEASSNRISWARRTATGFEVDWSGRVPHLDRYDASAPAQSFELRVDAPIVHRAFESVRGGLMYVEGSDEEQAVTAIRDELIPILAADLIQRDWFARMPFSAIDLIVRVDGPRRRWPAPPRRLRDYAAAIVVSIDSKAIKQANRYDLRAVFERQVAGALEQLEPLRGKAQAPTFLT